ncbi:hypothetical protein KY361_03290 [Candidatus Woesearchaeota archaeon]|nr:hypothetical protein [Candidatus Woesearchaeota archaeon]
MPGEPEFTYRFGEYLATRLGPQLNPIGFNMAVQLTLADLHTGVSGFTGEPVPHSLSGQPAAVYVAMEFAIPGIAEAVCPEDFAEQVKLVYEETHKD